MGGRPRGLSRASTSSSGSSLRLGGRTHSWLLQTRRRRRQSREPGGDTSISQTAWGGVQGIRYSVMFLLQLFQTPLDVSPLTQAVGQLLQLVVGDVKGVQGGGQLEGGGQRPQPVAQQRQVAEGAQTPQVRGEGAQQVLAEQQGLELGEEQQWGGQLRQLVEGQVQVLQVSQGGEGGGQGGEQAGQSLPPPIIHTAACRENMKSWTLKTVTAVCGGGGEGEGLTPDGQEAQLRQVGQDLQRPPQAGLVL